MARERKRASADCVFPDSPTDAFIVVFACNLRSCSHGKPLWRKEEWGRAGRAGLAEREGRGEWRAGQPDYISSLLYLTIPSLCLLALRKGLPALANIPQGDHIGIFRSNFCENWCLLTRLTRKKFGFHSATSTNLAISFKFGIFSCSVW